MTNKIVGRTEQHRESRPGTFTAQYHIHRLVYFEYFQYVRHTIAREKELKRFTRTEKIELIEKVNPAWMDLYPQLAALEQQILSEDDKTRKARTTAKAKAKAKNQRLARCITPSMLIRSQKFSSFLS